MRPGIVATRLAKTNAAEPDHDHPQHRDSRVGDRRDPPCKQVPEPTSQCYPERDAEKRLRLQRIPKTATPLLRLAAGGCNREPSAVRTPAVGGGPKRTRVNPNAPSATRGEDAGRGSNGVDPTVR